MKNIAFGLLFAALVFIAVILWRTMSYGGVTSNLKAIDLPEAPTVAVARATENLASAIRFRTIAVPPVDGEIVTAPTFASFRAWLATTYPLVHDAMILQTLPGGTLIFTWRGTDTARDPLLLMAHQDVVPVNEGTASAWKRPPFAGEIADGYIYGRGALDDKGSLIALMEAAESLIASGFNPSRTILFLFGHDEEIAGSGAKAAIALLKSQGVTPAFVLDEGAPILEKFPLTNKPMALIGVSEKGYLTLEITATGQGGHSSMPPRNSAAVRLARALILLDENQMLADYSGSPFADIFRAAAPDMPFLTRMAFANLWLFRGLVDKQIADIPGANALVRTTMAPTQLTGAAAENVLAQRASARINFRIHPNDNPENIIAHVDDIIRKVPGVTLSTDTALLAGSAASPVSPTDNRAFAILSAVAHEASGGAPVTPFLVVGATDARHAAAIAHNVYRFTPAILTDEDIAGFHGTNERLSVRNLELMIRSYTQIMMAMDANL